MSFEEFYALFADHIEPRFPELFLSRKELIGFIEKKKVFDAIVIGGGVHGAVCARLAALHGLRTLLLEQLDYGAETVLRAPEMLYAPFRLFHPLYLKAARAERDITREVAGTAPHLMKQEAVAVWMKASRGEFVEHAVRQFLKRLLVVSGPSGILSGEGDNSARGLLTGEWNLDEPRFVLENILAARQEGTACLNHARVDAIGDQEEGGMEVSWTDCLSGERHVVRAGAVLNCTGTRVAQTARVVPRSFSDRLAHFLEATLVFKGSWDAGKVVFTHPDLFSPCIIRKAGASTFVSTAIGPLSDPAKKGETGDAFKARIAGIIKEFFPTSELDEKRIVEERLGVRSIIAEPGEHATTPADHPWNYDWITTGGQVHLLGGSSFRAYRTAFDGLGRILTLADRPVEWQVLQGRLLPGAWKLGESRAAFLEQALQNGVSLHVAQDTFGRLGSLVRLLSDDAANYEVIGGCVLAGELELSVSLLQAEDMEDVLERRLGVSAWADGGEAARRAIEEWLTARGLANRAEETAEATRTHRPPEG